MSDKDPGPHVGAAPSGTVRATVPEAARALGISERSVRKRLVAGTLGGIKEGKSWVVLLPATAAAALADSHAAPHTEHTDPAGFADLVAAQTYGPHAALEIAAVEALERLFRDEQRRADENRDAALHWQFRALRAEEKLAAIEAGPATSSETSESANDPVDAPGAPGSVVPPPVDDLTLREAHDAPVPAQAQLAVGWRRWFHWLMES